MNRLLHLAIPALLAISAGCSDPIDRILDERHANAEQGDAEAQYQLGTSYHAGEFMPKDVALAMKWYRRAADQGHVEAMYTLGWMHDFGEDVEKNSAQAMKWYLRAAAHGHAEAQETVCREYAYGSLAPNDYVEAYVWHSVVVANGRGDDALRDLITSITASLTPQELSQAQQRAAELIEKIDSVTEE